MAQEINLGVGGVSPSESPSHFIAAQARPSNIRKRQGMWSSGIKIQVRQGILQKLFLLKIFFSRSGVIELSFRRILQLLVYVGFTTGRVVACLAEKASPLPDQRDQRGRENREKTCHS